MSSMRAVLFDKTGDSSVLQLRETAKPTPSPTEVLVKVEYSGINFIDVYLRSGVYPASLPSITGVEGAGTIESVGASVPADLGLKAGDRVAFCGGSGSAAENTTVEAGRVAKLPEGVSTRDGAALLLQGLTAWTLVRDAHELRPGETILVQSAAGGTGGLLVQMAKHLGATVIGTVSTHEKAEVARRHGADHVVVYTERDFLQEVLDITKGQGCHAVYSGVGRDTFAKDLEATRRRGSFVSYGNASGPVTGFSPLDLRKNNVRLLRPTVNGYVETREEWDQRTKELFDLVAEGAVKVSVGKEYGFDQVAQAQDDLTSKKTTGKLVIKITP